MVFSGSLYLCLLNVFGVHSVWYFGAAHKHYIGPQSNLGDHSVKAVVQDEPVVAETEKVAA